MNFQNYVKKKSMFLILFFNRTIAALYHLKKNREEMEKLVS